MTALVALDLGGVIVDVDHGRCAEHLQISRKALDDAFFADGLHDRVTIGTLDGRAFVAAAARRLGLPADEVERAWTDVVRVLPAGRALVNDLIGAGHRVHLWTNTDPIHLAHIIGALPPEVSAATASCLLGTMKPEPTYWQRAVALGPPTVFVDDRDDNVRAARAAGIVAHSCRGSDEARASFTALGLL